MGTAGGGVTNLVTAVANAYSDGVSVVFFGGSPPLRDYDALPVNSGIDQLDVMRGITKWAHRVTHIERLADLVGRAFQSSRGGCPGPVYLELPVTYSSLLLRRTRLFTLMGLCPYSAQLLTQKPSSERWISSSRLSAPSS